MREAPRAVQSHAHDGVLETPALQNPNELQSKLLKGGFIRII